MAVANVKKVNIIAHKGDQKEVVDFLYNSGLMEINDQQGKAKVVSGSELSSSEIISQIEHKISNIQFAIKFLDEYEREEKVSLLEKLQSGKIEIKKRDIEKILKKYSLSEIVDKCEGIDEKINELESEVEQLKEDIELLGKWKSLNINVNGVYSTETVQALFGLVEADKYHELIRELDKKIGQVEVRKIENDEQQEYLAILFARELEKEVEKVLFKYDFDKVDLPQTDKEIPTLLADLEKDLVDAKKAVKKRKKEAHKLADKYLKNLKILFDYYTWQVDQKSAERKFQETTSTFQLNGWVREDNVKLIEKGLSNITKSFVVEEVKPGKGESIPVVIKNSSFMEPFEAVTNIYGLPKHREVDPTPFLSIFFIVFFGLCLTDAGYGLLLMGLTYLAIKVLKIPRESQKLIRLLMYGGFVTFIIGALTGGWFGVALEDLPDSFGFVKSALLAVKVIDPIKDPITLLGISFLLGFIQIWVGIAIDMWWKIKIGRTKDGLLDSLPWMYFLLSIAFYAATAVGALPESLKQISFYAFIVGLVAIVLTQGRDKKNIFLKLISGVGSLYGLVGYMSDILSYSRLLALGLATAVIAMVINLIAVLFRDLVPYVGWVLMVLILIGGHIFNITINVLGAYIHSGRLQFVEFFPKFLQGGGRIFRPFKRVSKYVELKE